MGRAGRAQEAEPSVMTSPHLGADRVQRERGCLASQSELPCGLRQPWASLGHCPSCPGKEPLKFEGALWFLWTGAQRPEYGRALLPLWCQREQPRLCSVFLCEPKAEGVVRRTGPNGGWRWGWSPASAPPLGLCDFWASVLALGNGTAARALPPPPGSHGTQDRIHVLQSLLPAQRVGCQGSMKLKGSPLWDAWPPVPSFVPASGNSGRGCGYWEGLWVLRDRCPGSELVPMWTRRSPPEALAVAQGKTSQPGCLLDREGGGRGGQGRETSDPFIPSPCQPAGLSLGDAEHGDSLPRPSRPAA